MKFPKLLLITPCAFNHVTGGGVTFSNLFRGWPADKIATIHNDIVPVTQDICNTYYFVSREFQRIPPWHWLRLSKNSTVCTSSKLQPGKSLPGHWGKSVIKHLIKRIIGKNTVPKLLGDSDIPERFTPSRELVKFLDKFRPDVVYTILGSNAMMELIDWTCRRYECSLVVHMMDDWYSCQYQSGIFRNVQRRKMKSLVSHLLKNASIRMAICDAMAEAFQQRFGCKFLAFHNAIDTQKWATHCKRDVAQVSTPALLRYVGSVLPYAQTQSLVDIGHAVDIIAHKRAIVFELYVPHIYQQTTQEMLSFSQNCKILPEICDDETFYQTMATSDVLILPSNFDQHSIKFISFSMPAKVPAYLLSKTPILVYGSPATAQVKYAMQHGWGYCVSEPNQEKLVTSVCRLLEDVPLRKRLAEKAFELARNRHDTNLVAREFQQVLCSTALNP